MRMGIVLIFALLVLAASNHAHATTERGLKLAQIIPSCAEQANVWYLQYIGFKCNTPNPPQRDTCQLLMQNICDLAEKKRCAGARPYCLIKKK